MKVIFVRHGEPDYTPCEARGFVGHGVQLAPLSQRGIEQAKNAAKSELLNGAEIIISSPYTRALQTASYIARQRQLDVIVDVDLREWEPDLSFMQNKFGLEEYDDYRLHDGIYPDNQKKLWETTKSVTERAINCLKAYVGRYDTIIVTAHGELMRCLTGALVDYCGIAEYELK